MEGNKNTPQQPQVPSGIMEVFGMWILMFMFDGVQNTGRNLLIDVLKSDDDGKLKELAVLLGADEDNIRRGIGKIKITLKEQAERKGMSVDELIGLFK